MVPKLPYLARQIIGAQENHAASMPPAETHIARDDDPFLPERLQHTEGLVTRRLIAGVKTQDP